MKTIWKYKVPITDFPEISMPAMSEVLTVQLQGGVATMWVLVQPDAPKIPRRFAIVGTGNPAPDNLGRYVATWQDGPFVWHLFEVDW